MDVTAFLAATALGLVLWGLISAWIGARRGDDAFEWWLLGTALGPLSLPALLHAHPRGDGAGDVSTGVSPADDAAELAAAGGRLDPR